MIDPIELVAQVAEGVMLQLMTQPTDRTVDGDRFMDVFSAPARRSPIVQARLVVRVEIRRPYPSSQVIGDAWDAVTPLRWLGCNNGADLFRQRRRYSLVGIERKNPVMYCALGGEILLIDVSGPRAAEDGGAFAAGDVECSVGAA